jgi:hypothetical protein
LYHLFMLHCVIIGRILKVNFLLPAVGRGLARLVNRRGVVRLKREPSSPCFPGYTEDVVGICLGVDRQKFFETFTLYFPEDFYLTFTSTTNDMTNDPMMQQLPDFCAQKFYMWEEFEKGLERPAFKIALRNLFFKHKIDV